MPKLDEATKGSEPSQLIDPEQSTTCNKPFGNKAVVVGLYGVPGSGKTTLLHLLKKELGEDHFSYYDGSEMIAAVVPGGLDAFQEAAEKEREHWRRVAIDKIDSECLESGKTGVVAGHYMFWEDEKQEGDVVCTEYDLNVFTHMLYLDVPISILSERRLFDTDRLRPYMSPNHLNKWQRMEKNELQRLCRENGILFSKVSEPQPPQSCLPQVSMLLHDFHRHTEEYNSTQARHMLDCFLTSQNRLHTVLVMDADRTLGALDTGKLFWKKVCNSEDDPLRALFNGPLGYSYTAFRQAVLLYEEAAGHQNFEALCQDVAAEVTMHPEFVLLLRLVAKSEHVSAVIATCGLRRIWEIVLEREELSKTVGIIGGGRIKDNFVVTAQVKADLVTHLQDVHHMYVWAFGDSPLDLEMLHHADEAVVVTGEDNCRSKTMDTALEKAIRDGLQARQVLLPGNAAPRLDTITLPVVQIVQPSVENAPFSITEAVRHHHEVPEKLAPDFTQSILCRRRLDVDHATEKTAARLLMTHTRDAEVAGPALREAHWRIGWYLAIEFLADTIGVEEIPILHVQGHRTTGHRLLHESRTTIVALMRGGEPMALGINDAFPLAMFLHASRPSDLKSHYLEGQSTILLVDSVVNSGKTIVEFVEAIRRLHASIRIVIVAGVVQAKAVSEGKGDALGRYGNVSLVALRLSDNKYTGSGTTDTGNRLFNTTHLA